MWEDCPLSFSLFCCCSLVSFFFPRSRQMTMAFNLLVYFCLLLKRAQGSQELKTCNPKSRSPTWERNEAEEKRVVAIFSALHKAGSTALISEAGKFCVSLLTCMRSANFSILNVCVFSVEKSVLGADVVVSFNERPQTFFPGCRNERPSAPDESWWRKLVIFLTRSAHLSDKIDLLFMGLKTD